MDLNWDMTKLTETGQQEFVNPGDNREMRQKAGHHQSGGEWRRQSLDPRYKRRLRTAADRLEHFR